MQKHYNCDLLVKLVNRYTVQACDAAINDYSGQLADGSQHK